jgi:hypothetical protein
MHDSQQGLASDQGLPTMPEIVTKRKVGEFSRSQLADFGFLREALADPRPGNNGSSSVALTLIWTLREFSKRGSIWARVYGQDQAHGHSYCLE